MLRGPASVILMLMCPALYAQQSQPSTETPAPQQTVAATTEKPRVFITDSQSWETRGSAGGGGGAFAAESHGGARPQTAEIIKTFGQRCPGVIVNNRQDVADYIVVLDHEGGKGYLQHRNKVAVFEHVSGDVVVSKSTLSLGGSVEDACNGIVQNWATHSKDLLATRERPPTAAQPVAIPSPAPAPPAAPAQASVQVDSTPAGADIEIDGAFVGNTPSTVNVAPGSHQVAVKKKGFTDWTKTLNVSGGTVHLSAELEQAPATPPPAAPQN